MLLLEAGGWDRDPWIHIPLGWGKILQKRLHDWNYFCEPEENVGGRSVECARGKVVGGCSSTNAMAYVRGNPRRLTTAGRAGGAAGWSHADVLPYFRKLERWEGGASAYRGGDGPLSVQTCRYQDPLIGAFADAGQIGRPPLDRRLQRRSAARLLAPADDHRARPARQRGHAPICVRRWAAEPCASRSTPWRSASSRGRPSAAASNIVQGGVAAHCATAEREVILCGGVINTPQLLMLSGVGDPAELGRHGIAVKQALPGVGRNLQDHVSVILMYHRREPGPFLPHDARTTASAANSPRAYLFGTGFAADVPGGGVAFLKSRADLALPDIQLLLTAAPLGAWPYLAAVQGALQGWLRLPHRDAASGEPRPAVK